jgi:4-amino-4-deoxy-L-arabinose transferase-like glycosyltransferase
MILLTFHAAIRAQATRLATLVESVSEQTSHQAFLSAIIILSLALFSLAGYVNQIPWWDDKAYLNNALIHSGRITKDLAHGPYADERPPLFWWIETALFLLNTPVSWAKYVSPLFGVVIVIVTYFFAAKLFRNARYGFYAALFLATNALVLQFAGMNLTDIPGTALATIFVFCFYFAVLEKNNLYLVLSGVFLAFSLIMRDQNLIVFPVVVFFLVTRLKLNKYLKALLAVIASLSLGIPVILSGLTNSLRVASKILTPVVVGDAYRIPFTSVGISSLLLAALLGLAALTYLRYSRYNAEVNNIVGPRIPAVAFGALLFFVFLYPYLWDNYALFAGGIFSRMISHEIMSETIGVGANLTASQRSIWWVSKLPELLSITLMILAPIGLVQLFRKRMYEPLAILLPWVAFTTGFTIFFAYLETRFFLPALPVLAILASKGFVDLVGWIKSKMLQVPDAAMKKAALFVEGVLAFSFALFGNLQLIDPLGPHRFAYLSALNLLTSAYSGLGGWFSTYSQYLSNVLTTPSLKLDPTYILESGACFIFLILFAAYLVRSGLEPASDTRSEQSHSDRSFQ